MAHNNRCSSSTALQQQCPPGGPLHHPVLLFLSNSSWETLLHTACCWHWQHQKVAVQHLHTAREAAAANLKLHGDTMASAAFINIPIELFVPSTYSNDT
jgi:hypothetical protein